MMRPSEVIAWLPEPSLSVAMIAQDAIMPVVCIAAVH